MTESPGAAVAAAGLALADIDLFVYHQANAPHPARGRRAARARPPERVVDCIAPLGNTSAASIPLALGEAPPRTAASCPAPACCSRAFGAGFTWGGDRDRVGER